MFQAGHRQFIRFLLVGGLNTFFGLAAFGLLALTELPTWAVLIGSNLAGLAFNFFTTGGLVFRDLELRRLPAFTLSYVGIFFMYLVGLKYLTPIMGNRVFAMAILAGPMAIFTYFVQSRLVFRSSPKRAEEVPTDTESF
jgi:putative flippase GtrA